MAKMSMTFEGFEQMAQDLDRIGGDLMGAVKETLNETQNIVQRNTTSASASYARKGGGLKGYARGAMFGTIVKGGSVKWAGTTASVDVGFHLNQKGGFHSIFVMYGTPKMSKDTRVYNAIRGARTKQEIYEKQKDIMQKYLSFGGGK